MWNAARAGTISVQYCNSMVLHCFQCPPPSPIPVTISCCILFILQLGLYPPPPPLLPTLNNFPAIIYTLYLQLGFAPLLRGLRDDVRPSLRRRVLQAIATIVDSDPALAPHLLGLDDYHDENRLYPGQHASDGSGDPLASAAADKESGRTKTASKTSGKNKVRGGTAARAVNGDKDGDRGVIGSRVRRRLRGAARRSRRGSRIAGAGGAGDSAAVAIADLTAGTEDVLLERIAAILGFHSSGSGGGGGSSVGVGGGSGAARVFDTANANAGASPVGRVLRAAVELLPLPVVRPSCLPLSTIAGGVGLTGNRRGSGRKGRRVGRDRVVAGSGVVKGSGAGAAEASEEGRAWWKDDVAVEEEGLEQKAANLAAGGGWWWWWGRGRVSRERLVEEALELTFRLVMSGDVVLNVMKEDAGLVAALRRVAEGGGQRLQYDAKVRFACVVFICMISPPKQTQLYTMYHTPKRHTGETRHYY